MTIGLRRVKKMSKEEADKRAMDLLKTGGLREQGGRVYPSKLSGARNSVWPSPAPTPWDPEVILFDEATSALDPEMVEGEVLKIMRQLAECRNDHGGLTPRDGLCREVGDRVVFMDGGCHCRTGNHAGCDRKSQHKRTKDFLSKML